MKIRIIALPTEVEQAVKVLNDAEVFDVIEVSDPYPNRGPTQMVRVYAELQIRQDNEIAR